MTDKKEKTVFFRISEHNKIEIQKAAEQNNESVAQFIRKAVFDRLHNKFTITNSLLNQEFYEKYIDNEGIKYLIAYNYSPEKAESEAQRELIVNKISYTQYPDEHFYSLIFILSGTPAKGYAIYSMPVQFLTIVDIEGNIIQTLYDQKYIDISYQEINYVPESICHMNFTSTIYVKNEGIYLDNDLILEGKLEIYDCRRLGIHHRRYFSGKIDGKKFHMMTAIEFIKKFTTFNRHEKEDVFKIIFNETEKKFGED